MHTNICNQVIGTVIGATSNKMVCTNTPKHCRSTVALVLYIMV